VLLTPQPSLVEQAYDAILGEIADGSLPPSTHLIQEDLAARYGVSRQPIQQALLLLKSDGIVQDAGRRGLIVAPLDMQMMRDRYEVRAALDALAARLAAQRCAASPAVAAQVGTDGTAIVEGGLAAVEAGDVNAMIAQDVAFHSFIYAASGNAMIAPSAELHWRFLRRVMGEVLRTSGPPIGIWEQHRDILNSIVAGDASAAEQRIVGHIKNAAGRLVDGTGHAAPQNKQDEERKRTDAKRRADRIDGNRPG